MRKEVEEQLLKLKEESVPPIGMIERWESLDMALTDNELLEVAQWFIQDDVFWWLPLINHILPQIASYLNFLELISTIAHRVRGDLAQGPFINALITIGENQPTLAEELCARIRSEYPNLLEYSGFLLGGAARADNRLREKVLNEVAEKTGNECVSLIRALRVTFEKTEHIDQKSFQPYNF